MQGFEPECVDLCQGALGRCAVFLQQAGQDQVRLKFFNLSSDLAAQMVEGFESAECYAGVMHAGWALLEWGFHLARSAKFCLAC